MVAFRVGGIELASLGAGEFETVLEAATEVGGATRFPLLFGLARADSEVEPIAMMDELARLSASDHAPDVDMLVGRLRDDLMAAVAAASEG